MLNIRNESFKTLDEVKELAPSIFTTTAAENVSSHYTHIPTSRVIEDMATLGWGIVDAKEVKARQGIGYQKHLVVFRNPEISITGNDGDVVYPQILLTNSHDGKNAFTFTAGLFRMVCENGLVISSDKFEDVKMRHMGYTFEELQSNIHNMVERLPLTVDSMNTMKQTILDQEQMIEFAKQAISSRFNDDELDTLNIDITELLTPTRTEDTGSDLWSVFNIVQEKIIHGGFQYTNNNNKTRKARRIKNFNQDINVNKALFETALSFAN